MPTAIEHHVDWIADCITHMNRNGQMRIEAAEDAQDAWAEHVAEVAEHTLWGKGNSWYIGANIPGKPRIILPYTGGQPQYRERCQAVVDAGQSIGDVGAGIFDRLLEVASGSPTKSEIFGFGDDEFVPWQIGAVM